MDTQDGYPGWLSQVLHHAKLTSTLPNKLLPAKALRVADIEGTIGV